MTGYAQENRPAFQTAASTLRRLGFNVISPDELDASHPAAGDQWSDYLARDLPHLIQAHMGVALPGWRESKGATLEATILHTLGRPVFALEGEALHRIPDAELPFTCHPVPVHGVISSGGRV